MFFKNQRAIKFSEEISKKQDCKILWCSMRGYPRIKTMYYIKTELLKNYKPTANSKIFVVRSNIAF
jgi:hypothetical protein